MTQKHRQGGPQEVSFASPNECTVSFSDGFPPIPVWSGDNISNQGVQIAELHPRSQLQRLAASHAPVSFGGHTYLVWSTHPGLGISLEAETHGLGWAQHGSEIQVAMPGVGRSLLASAPGAPVDNLGSVRAAFTGVPDGIGSLGYATTITVERALSLPDRLSPEQIQTLGGRPPLDQTRRQWMWTGPRDRQRSY